jgi:hypothetical protein
MVPFTIQAEFRLSKFGGAGFSQVLCRGFYALRSEPLADSSGNGAGLSREFTVKMDERYRALRVLLFYRP